MNYEGSEEKGRREKDKIKHNWLRFNGYDEKVQAKLRVMNYEKKFVH
jgi:hypothetical protein